MYRKDPDGNYHYTKEEIFDGFIVKKNEGFGYWGSEL